MTSRKLQQRNLDRLSYLIMIASVAITASVTLFALYLISTT